MTSKASSLNARSPSRPSACWPGAHVGVGEQERGGAVLAFTMKSLAGQEIVCAGNDRGNVRPRSSPRVFSASAQYSRLLILPEGAGVSHETFPGSQIDFLAGQASS